MRIGADVDRMEIECGSMVDVLLENDGPHWRTVRFEHHGYREDAATAVEVLGLPEFRESFPDVQLPAGAPIPTPPGEAAQRTGD